MAEKPVGKVEHYYPKVQAAAVRLSGTVKLGDQVHIVGHGDDVQEKVSSLQLDHVPIEKGTRGQSVGLWVKERVHEGDDVLLVQPDKARPRSVARRPRTKTARKAATRGKSPTRGRKPKKAAKGKAKPKRAAPRKATRKR